MALRAKLLNTGWNCSKWFPHCIIRNKFLLEKSVIPASYENYYVKFDLNCNKNLKNVKQYKTQMLKVQDIMSKRFSMACNLNVFKLNSGITKLSIYCII